jgi:hypothetical protein
VYVYKYENFMDQKPIQNRLAISATQREETSSVQPLELRYFHYTQARDFCPSAISSFTFLTMTKTVPEAAALSVQTHPACLPSSGPARRD